jgi:RimJ/RimL family protein N-acetyltransferase
MTMSVLMTILLAAALNMGFYRPPARDGKDPYLHPHTLITDRLQLSPITTADADRLAVLHADARVMSLLQHGVLSRAQSDEMVANYAAEWPALGFGSWTVTERASSRLIGLGGLRVHDGDHGIALRVALIPEVQGKGYGPELGRAVVDFAFTIAGLDRVAAVTRLDNLPAQRLLEKIGMVLEREFSGGNGRALLLYAVFNPNSGRTQRQGRTRPA